MKWFVIVAAFAAVFAVASAEDKKQPSPVELKLVNKGGKYKFDGGGLTAAEYKTSLLETAKKIDKGEKVSVPKAQAVDLVLQITNTSKEDVTIHVGGDSNVYTFDLTGGAGEVVMNNPVAFTADFKLPKAVTLAPTKSHEIPVKQLSDGTRGAARLVFWTGPGEYTLAARYTLADAKGGKGAELKSEPIKITVEK